MAGADVPLVIARRLHGRELFGRSLNGFHIEDGQATLEVGDEPDPESVEEFLSKPLAYNNQLRPLTGAATVRFIVRDNNSGKMGSVIVETNKRP